METNERPDKDTSDVLPILRGLLAKPSGNEDDPYARVILTSINANGLGKYSHLPPLVVENVGGSSEEIRERLRRLLDEYLAARGEMPNAVRLPGETAYMVTRDEPSPEKPLANKVAVVTGAAGAIGFGICRGLLMKGCRVAATDLNSENLDSLVAELDAIASGATAGIIVDVTDPASVKSGFEQVSKKWGGIDLVVVNAGVAFAADLMGMDLQAFRRIEKVNVEGTLLTLAEAGRCMRRQGTGGDIVLISTKNVFSPGAQFGAYSATKAAAHQLARIASLEYASFGVRVNMVAPDAVFSGGGRKSGLWQEVGPSRMKARGLDEKGLEEYYRNRNLLKARVTAEHVANAVLFFATRQTPTTGATIPVDGGLPDSTPR